MIRLPRQICKHISGCLADDRIEALLHQLVRSTESKIPMMPVASSRARVATRGENTPQTDKFEFISERERPKKKTVTHPFEVREGEKKILNDEINIETFIL